MTLMIRNLAALVTCNGKDEVLERVDLFCADGIIRAIGKRLPQKADRELDGTHLLLVKLC